MYTFKIHISFLLSLLIIVPSCCEKAVEQDQSCNWVVKYLKENPKGKIVFQHRPSVFENTMFYKREDQLLQYVEINPKSTFETGILYSNICKLLVYDKPLRYNYVIPYFEYCFKLCPILAKDSLLYQNRFKSNLSNNDSLTEIVLSLNYESNTDSDPEFATGSFIDNIASLDLKTTTNTCIEKVLDLRLLINEAINLSIETEDSYQIIKELAYEFSQLDSYYQIATKTDSIIPIKSVHVSSEEYISTNRELINNIILKCKNIRNSVCGTEATDLRHY